MARELVLAFFLVGCGGGYEGPDCEAVTLSDLSVDTTSGTPVFDWVGAPNALWVSKGEADPKPAPDESPSGLGRAVWDLQCECDEASGCTDDEQGWKMRACLTPTITYGEVPDTTVEVSLEADPLESGSLYTVGIQTYCRGERKVVPNYNGGDPFHVSAVSVWSTFAAP